MVFSLPKVMVLCITCRRKGPMVMSGSGLRLMSQGECYSLTKFGRMIQVDLSFEHGECRRGRILACYQHDDVDRVCPVPLCILRRYRFQVTGTPFYFWQRWLKGSTLIEGPLKVSGECDCLLPFQGSLLWMEDVKRNYGQCLRIASRLGTSEGPPWDRCGLE